MWINVWSVSKRVGWPACCVKVFIMLVPIFWGSSLKHGKSLQSIWKKIKHWVEDKKTLRENLCDTPFNVNVKEDEISSRMWLDDTHSHKHESI